MRTKLSDTCHLSPKLEFITDCIVFTKDLAVAENIDS